MIRLVHLDGPRSAPPFVAVPGIDGSEGSVQPILEALARTRRVILVDYQRERHATLATLASEIADRLTVEVTEPFDLMGQSIGSIVAATIDGMGTAPVRRLVLCCTFTRLRWTALRLTNAIARITPDALFAASSPLLMRVVCGPVGDGGGHPFFSAVRHADRRGVIKRTSWEIGADFAPALAGIRAPALVLMGARDRFVPDAARELATLRVLYAGRDVRIISVPDAGHVLLPSAAIRTAASAMERFLGEAAA